MDRKIILKKDVLSMEMAYLIENELVYYYAESNAETNWQNCILVGQVQDIVKNLNAVFIHYGKNKTGLLPFSQIPNRYLDKIKQGYLLPVQIIKQNSGSKGNKLTAKLNFTGKHLICLPFEPGIHFSKKITLKTFRESTKQALNDLETPYGFIVRTHAMHIPLEEILQDAENLITKVYQILNESQYLVKGSILYEEQPSIYQMLIEKLTKQIELEIICDHQEVSCFIKTLVKDYSKSELIHLKCMEQEKNIFALYGLTKKIEQVTQRKIWLKNGGNIIIDKAEAMTVIDVNSAKAILIKEANKAILTLNKEAVKEVILQILRRNLSGIILVDLVEMKSEEDALIIYQYAKQLLNYYEDELTQVYPLTQLGLLQFSRTKKYQSVIEKLLDNCPKCYAPYTQKSYLAQLMQLEKQLKSITLSEGKQNVYLRVSSHTYEIMMTNHVQEKLERAYPIQIEIEKVADVDNQILCQFCK